MACEKTQCCGGNNEPSEEGVSVLSLLDEFIVTEDQVRTLAYEKWERAGYPAGDGTDFWLAAEQELFN